MKLFIQTAILVLICFSCTDEPVETVFPDINIEEGVLIACEGNFMYGNGSLSFYDYNNRTVIRDFFYGRNNAPLGDIVQSLGIFGDKIFIVVNNSGKVYIADSKTVEFRGVISGLSSPRHIHIVSDNKAYVSDLLSNHITIIDPVSNRITGTINLGFHTSEKMVQTGNKVFVTSWSYGKHVLVIDPETDELITTIEVPLQPKDIVADKNQKLWVLSDGGYEGSPAGHENPALSRIDPFSYETEQIYRFEETAMPSVLEINNTGDTLYLINGDLYKMPVNSNNLPESPFIESGGRMFYSLGIDPGSDEIYIADVIDWSQNGEVLRFSQSGDLIDSFKVGVNPADFLFR
jgi:YVTN family beta-propeller protein